MTERIKIRLPRPGSLIAHAILVLGAIWLAGPFLWEVLTAFKTLTEATSVPPTWLPAQWRFGNFTAAFRGIPLLSMLSNSVINTLVRTAGQVLFSATAAYAFARLRFPGRNLLFGLFRPFPMWPARLLVIPRSHSSRC